MWAVWWYGWLWQALLMGGYSLVRLTFVGWNGAFLESGASLGRVFLKGLIFDFTATSWLTLPAWLALLLQRLRLAYGLWISATSLSLALEVIDVGYFPYTHRRSGPELLAILTFWQDSLPALSKYVRDFLVGFVLWGMLVALLAWAGWYVLRRASPPPFKPWAGWLFSLSVLAVGVRGSVSLKPLSVIDATVPGCPTCSPFVLNSTFAFVRALEQPRLPPWPLADPTIAPYPRLWEPDNAFHPAPRYNVVVLILESFSAEYVERGYAPFLAELLQKSASVRKAYATNSRSAEGLPAILSGMPSWGEEPLIFTPYAVRIRYSLGELLRKWGYHTAFFHGGNNGTMLLDSYALQAGFERYYGRREYPHPDRDYDGTWGIWDGPFLQFCAQKLGELKEPFCGVIFTLSSHHPYAVPAEMRDRFRGGPLPIHASVQYADWALRAFFAAVETTAWAPRTLFVLTADHTGPSEEPYDPVRVFQVPLGFYVPGKALPPCAELASHLDVVPSVLHAIGYPWAVPVWGRSVWDTTSARWAPQKPLPLLFQAVGQEGRATFSPHEGVRFLRWGSSRPDSMRPKWVAEWLTYLASYGAWIEGRSEIPKQRP